jgi:uncharacterized protein (TIGR00369 family)
MQPIMNAQDIDAFLDREFPQIHVNGRVYSVTEVRPGEAVVRLDASEAHLRPGGTVSGPTLFALADLAAYAVLLAHIGPIPLAVTTSATVNFLRKPPPGTVYAMARLLKLGKRLAVIEIGIAPTARAMDLVAHATATYSIPQR